MVRMTLAREYDDLFQPPKPPRGNPYIERALTRKMHLNDQSICGPYVVEHDAQRGQYRIVGYKRRTSGRVVLATLKYRASDEMYWPMFEQSGIVADMLATYLNNLHIVIKDPRQT
jgi:hypothetical protein